MALEDVEIGSQAGVCVAVGLDRVGAGGRPGLAEARERRRRRRKRVGFMAHHGDHDAHGPAVLSARPAYADALCVKEGEGESLEPRIICSMGLSVAAGGK